MYNEIEKKDRIGRFLKDKNMSKAVYDVLLAAFLKPRKGSGVEEKAAAWISIEQLQEGWKELERYKSDDSEEKSVGKQVGL